MVNLSSIRKDMVIGFRVAGVCLPRTDNLVDVSKTCVSHLTKAYRNIRKVSSAKHNIRRISNMSGGDRRVLKKIVTRKRNTALSQKTSYMNTHLQISHPPKLFN